MDAMKLMNNLLEGCNSVVDEPAVPEVILPCHACGGDDTAAWEYVVCKQCYARGPICKTREVAIAAWNTLPRALRWTHEPPKVAGLYMFREVLTELGDGQYGPTQLLNITQDMLAYHHRNDFQWAGPIPAPID